MADEFWYRYEDSLVSAGVDEWDNPVGPPRVEVYKHEFRVIKHTPKGVWLDVYGRKRFVLNTSRKRYAHASIDEARASFIRRKECQIGILMVRVGNARAAIRHIKEP